MSGSHISPWLIVRDHVRALTGGDERLSPIDLGRQYVLPVLAGFGVTGFLSVNISVGASVALLTIGGIFAAFTSQLALSLHTQALAFAGEQPDRGERTSRRCRALQLLAANAAYASLVSMLAALAALGTGFVEGDHPEMVVSAITIALFTHLSIVLLLILRRVFVDTKATLEKIAAGEYRPDSLV